MKNEAFTLIELLVVIVIIGIISAISITTFKGQRSKAENVQRMTVVNYYTDALRRMNASDEAFPVTTNKSFGSYKDIVCLIDMGASRCWDNNLFFIQSIRDKFDNHLQGVNEIQSVDFFSIDLERDGLIYSYPLVHPSHIALAASHGYSPKSAILHWVMDGLNYPCHEVTGGIINNGNYVGENKTYCVLFIEDIN